MAMKASYFVGKGSFEVRQAPELHPGAGEVVVRNKFCGVCAPTCTSSTGSLALPT